MATYTVFKRDDTIILYGCCLSAIGAMSRLLIHEEKIFEIRCQGHRFEIYAENTVQRKSLKRIDFAFSYRRDVTDATQEIAEMLIKTVPKWHWDDNIDCKTDEDFDLMLGNAGDQP